MAKRKIKEELVRFQNQKKEELWGVLTFPQKTRVQEIKGKSPGLIICHGFNQTKSQRKFVVLARKLAREGIVTFRFDFSGHGDSEGKIENLSIAGEVKELETAYKILVSKGKVNKEKVSVLGHSLGALIAVLFQREYKKANTLILLSPALHQKELMGRWYSSEELSLWKKQGYLDTPKGRIGIRYLKEAEGKDWQKVISQIEVPTFFIHGREDDDVPLKYTEELAEKIKGEKKLEIVEGTDHHFESKRAKDELIVLSLDWLNRHV